VAPSGVVTVKTVVCRLAVVKTASMPEQVLVNAEDPAVRRNRLALLERLKAAFGAVADIALLRG